MDIRHHFAGPAGLRAVWELLVVLRLQLSARLWTLRRARARRRLRTALPGLRRISLGPVRLYGPTVAAYTAADAAEADLERVCTLLESIGVPYFLVPSDREDSAPRPVVGVEETYRDAVLARAAQRFAHTAEYVGACGRDGTVTRAVLWA